MIKNLVFKLLFLFIICLNVRGEDLYLGNWLLPNKKVIIEIQKKDEEYIGFIRWLKDSVYPKGDKMEGQEQLDRNNPNLSLRDRKVLNLQVVGNLYRNEEGELVGGWIYDSWNGKIYYGTAKLIDKNRVKLRGSLDKWGILGYSMIAEKVELEKYKE